MAKEASSAPSIRLCLVHQDDAAVETLTAALGDARPDIQIQRIKSIKSLDAAMSESPFDAVLGPPAGKRLNAVKVREHFSPNEHQGQKVPVIGLRDPDSDVSVVEALKAGLADLVAIDQVEHMLLVIEREMARRQAVSVEAVAHHDFTGLYSRMHFLGLIEEILDGKAPPDRTRALAYVQLDSFSWINESFGIVPGDQFLKSIAGIISQAISENDLPARYHGGTFVLLIDARNINALEARCTALGKAIADHVFEQGNQMISSTASIGIALVSNTVEKSQHLISNAFKACEDAKAGGGNSLRWYGAQSTSKGKAADHEAWITRIRHAFENDMFTLLFQPIISLQGDQTPRYEVLLRMLNDDGETIAPGAFLPFAERAGLMSDIDRWVITHAIYAAHRQAERGIDCQMFLKLSGTALTDRKMPVWIDHAIKDNNCRGDTLVFEITESLALTNLAQTRVLINRLAQQGCRIGLDHFGTNANSLQFLEQVEVDYVKIDGSLIRGLAKNEQHQKLVRKIIEKARSKQVGIIAESIQDASSLPLIWQYGVEFIQGYFLQEPEPEMRYDFTELMV